MYSKKIVNRLNTYFHNRLGMVDYNRGWLKGDCPHCGKEQKFGVNLSSNRSNCFVCGTKKKPFTLLMMIENFVTKTEAMKFLMQFDESEVIEPLLELREEREVIIPESFKVLSLGDSQYGKSARGYMKSRGFDIDELSMSGWGYCSKGKYAGHIIMPFYNSGELFYFNARRFIGNGPKYNNPTAQDLGIGKSLVIYNIDALYKYDRVYIVESVMNAATLGDKAIAIGGKAISKHQLSLLIKSEVKEFVIILDSDATKEAVDQASKLANHKRVKIVHMPEEQDVNDIGKKRTMKRVMKSKWLTYNEILKLKLKFNAERS